MKISVAIITRNAASDLRRCLASVHFADEIVVLDQGSIDETAAVCAEAGAILHQTQWLGFGATKQKAVGLCRNEWVLSLDSDEEITPELAEAMMSLPDDPSAAAYAVNRLSRFLGRWIRHCGWHPEYVVRLFDRRRGRFNDKSVHEAIETSGKVQRLPGLVHHHTYKNLEQFLEKQNRYSTLAADELHARGRRVSLPGAVIRSKLTFLRMWVLQAGWLDGWRGVVLCMVSSLYTLSKYTKLWQLSRRGS